MEEQALLLCSKILTAIILSTLFYFLLKTFKTTRSSSPQFSVSYFIFGDAFALSKNLHRLNQYTTELIRSSPTKTIHMRRPYAPLQIVTANPSNVEHILKTHFYNYPKGSIFRSTFTDFLGAGIFNSDEEPWKFQRKVSSHEFNARSLRKFVETAVKFELSGRLIPLLAAAVAGKKTLDLQDILQRFAFDNICKIAFGSDPGCLEPNLPASDFADAFDIAVRLSGQRFICVFPAVWRVKRLLGIGSEKKLQQSIAVVRQFAESLVRERKKTGNTDGNTDLLSRFIDSGNLDESFITDIVVSFILAGRDTTSAALTWFFWLVSRDQRVEMEILKEISGNGKPETFEGVKDMVYLHAAICESMRLYPPVPSDSKQASENDVLPDGTVVRKGMKVTYHPYAMGRLEELWGKDWPEFRPERWLRAPENEGGGWVFVGEDPYKYPVFQAGPRVCLGKEMAFLQMKSLAAGVLRRFRVSPALEGFEPVFVSNMTSKMQGGFPVRIEEREGL